MTGRADSWLPLLPGPGPAPGEIRLWLCPVGKIDPADDRLVGVLTPAEREAASRFVFPEDARRFTAGRACLRLALGNGLGVAPGSLAFVQGPHGKPGLEPGSAPRLLHFNVSHAGSLAVIAVAADRPVGIDVEWTGREGRTGEIARRMFAPAETAAMDRLKGPAAREAFFRIWTRKEAVVKALGAGLTHPLDGFTVPLDPGGADGEPFLIRLPDGSRLLVWDLDLGPGHAGALAAPGPLPTLRRFAAEPLLDSPA
ncbi:MAG: 4'-phosphopantetheinyl transferase superfamily protein [Candidatus Krumholzibacteriia bacterium]